MPKVGRHQGPTDAGSAVANAHARAEAAAEARRVEIRRRARAAEALYGMSRREVERHHADPRWVVERAIEYAVAGDERMADYTLRHAIHAGVGVVELAGVIADAGAMRARPAG